MVLIKIFVFDCDYNLTDFCHKNNCMADNPKHKAAWDLFAAGHSQKDIARILGLSENTIGKWARDDDWKGKKAREAFLDDNIVTNLKDIAEYQVRALKHIKDTMEENGELELLPNGYFDGITKALGAIKQDFNNFKVNVTILKKFTEYLEQQDLALAKQITPLIDIYLNEIHKTQA